MQLDTPLAIFTGVRAWIKDAREHRVRNLERHNAALFALYTAATETQSYVRRQQLSSRLQKKPPSRDLKREEKLSNLWRSASVLIREFDHDLAVRCFDKGGYWIDPEAWSDEDIREAGIELNHVVKEARELLWS